MILLFPTNPGVTKQWTVTVDFVKNGFPKIEKVLDSWQTAVFFIQNYLEEDVSL